MVNFTKVLGLAGLATLCASMAFGQTTCAAAGGSAVTNIIRAEGTTEQVAQLTYTCAGPVNTTIPAGTGSIQLFLTPSLPVTSKVLNTTTGATEAIITVTNNINAATSTVQGIVSGSSVSFSGVTLAAMAANAATQGTYTFTVSNVRVNATSLAVSTGVPPNVTETVFVSGSAATINPAALNAVTVAFAQNGLGTTKLYKSFKVDSYAGPVNGFPNGVQLTGSTGANNFPACASYSPAKEGASGSTVYNAGYTAGKSLMTTVQLNENFASAFRQASVGGLYNTGEQSQVNVSTGANSVAAGTRIAINFSNVPSGAALYVPTNQIFSRNPAAPTSLASTNAAIQLTGSAAGSSFASVSASAATGVVSSSTVTVDPSFQVAPVSLSGGSGSAVFEVVTQDLTNLDVYYVPVFIVFTANPAIGTATPISVSVSFAPTGSTAIPNFAVGSSTTTLTAGTFSLCSTSMLFPFVTNQLGFDTGIAISNTSSDPYGSTYGATSQAGTCTLNFYGANAPSPASVTTPSVAAGTTYTTVVSGLAPNFQGYVIAQCQFQYGHAYGFVTNAGSAGPAAIAQGYVAGVIPDPVVNGGRAASPNGLAASNTGENLGQ